MVRIKVAAVNAELLIVIDTFDVADAVVKVSENKGNILGDNLVAGGIGFGLGGGLGGGYGIGEGIGAGDGRGYGIGIGDGIGEGDGYGIGKVVPNAEGPHVVADS